MKNFDDFLFLYNGPTRDWFCKYKDDLGVQIFNDQRGRWPTMKMAINLFLQRGGGLIVETGCQREPNDWGSGASTTLFEKVLRKYDAGDLVSVDNNLEHLQRAEGFVKHSSYTTFYEFDSVEFFTKWSRPINLLYLDSFDYPIREMLKPYGGEDNKETAYAALESLNEQEIIERHGDLLAPSQEHCLKEIQTAMPWLNEKSIILIDDNTLPGGGKGRLARQYLLDEGWLILLDYHQSLWIRG